MNKRNKIEIALLTTSLLVGATIALSGCDPNPCEPTDSTDSSSETTTTSDSGDGDGDGDGDSTTETETGETTGDGDGDGDQPDPDAPLLDNGEIICRDGDPHCLVEIAPGVWAWTYPNCDVLANIGNGYQITNVMTLGCKAGENPNPDFLGEDFFCMLSDDGTKEYCYVGMGQGFYTLVKPACDLPNPLVHGSLWGEWPEQCDDIDSPVSLAGKSIQEVACDGVFCWAHLKNDWVMNIRPSCFQGGEDFVFPWTLCAPDPEPVCEDVGEACDLLFPNCCEGLTCQIGFCVPQ